MNLDKTLIVTLLALLTSAFVGGCDSNELNLQPVSGTVKFADGTVPEGEIRIIKFVPHETEGLAKAASGDIQPDGSFQLTTVKHNDGVLPGDYAVVINIWKTYVGREPVIDKVYDDPATTPLTATVEEEKPNEFTFEVE